MFNKLIGFASLATLVGVASLSACTTTVTNTPTDGGTATADTGVKKDAGTGAETSTPVGPVACYDEAAAGAYDPAKVTVAAQKGACTDADIAAFSAACFGNGTQATCDQFTKDKPACSSCLFLGDAKDAAGKNILPALVPFGDSSVIPNTEACTAITLKNEAACGVAYVNETTCLVSSCATCADADFDSCVNSAADNVCADVLVDPAGTCGKAVTDNKAAVDAACSGTAFEDTFAKVAAVLCK